MKLFTLFVVGMCGLLLSYPAVAVESNAKQLYLIDDSTQTVLMEREAQTKMFPSSMSKLITVYALFEKLKDGTFTLNTELRVSEKAWRMGGSKMFVHVGDAVKVEDLLRGIVIQSGNDACVVVAEAIGGTEEGFAVKLNEIAKRLGMKNSNFTNSTGWPDEQHYTTAEDLAILAHHLINDFPEYYPYYQEKSFTYNGITQPNRNLLLGRGIGVDGLKTGHTEVAGYGITLSALDEATNRRINLVINGLSSEAERAREGETLLQYGLNFFRAITLVEGGHVVEQVPVWFGRAERVNVAPNEDVRVTVPRSDEDSIQYFISYDAPHAAPITQGQELATLTVKSKDKVLKTIPLYATNPVERAGFFARIGKALSYKLGL